MVVEGGKGVVEGARWRVYKVLMSMRLCGGGDHFSRGTDWHGQLRRSAQRLGKAQKGY